MNIGRREFMEVLGASLASLSLQGAQGEVRAETLEKGGWRLQVTSVGDIVSFTDGRSELIDRRLGDSRPRVVIGGQFYDLDVETRQYACERPSSSHREDSKLVFQYDFSGRDTFSVSYEVELIDLPDGMVALKQKIGLQAPTRIKQDVELVLPRNIRLPFENRKVFLPLKNGIGRRQSVRGFGSDNEYLYSMAGACKRIVKPQWLAIPMVDEYCDQANLRLTHCADPYFTSDFILPYRDRGGETNCTYLAQVGTQKEERLVYTALHHGGEKEAMTAFYATSLADVRPGPDWLHDVAMVGADDFSKNGAGWFKDVDTLEKLIAPADRHKVFLGLEGWMDYFGRYAFDWRKGVFDEEWTVFPRALDVHLDPLADLPDNGTEIMFHKRSLQALRPVRTSRADIHRRIRYAKDKGFRVGMYYADGTNAGDGLKETYAPDKVLHWGGWGGPETSGRTYGQNPLHPEVREFYRKYIGALLDEYGKEVDGFIWDESFVVAPNELGPDATPGYAGQGMMTLMKEVAADVASFSSQLAFFASDDIGAARQFEQAAPYALVTHGTYQDSWCSASAWPYGLFPNYRNILWSHNWAPVTRFQYSRYGVETFAVPVPWSVSYVGDDIGISEMTAQQQKQIKDLFEKRKLERMEISWIEEGTANPEYQGKDVARWTL
jgi:hypothetical protein